MDRPPLTETDLLRWAEALAGIARTGLGFTESLYEQERFEEILAIAADIRQHTSLGIDHEAQVDEWLKGVGKGVPGYVTPKVAIGAVVGNERGEILLVQRSDSGVWLYPTGWADIGYSPAEVAVKEVAEETGIHCRVNGLLAVLDGMRLGFTRIPLYSLVFHCTAIGGELEAHPLETSDVGWFARDQLPYPTVGAEWWGPMAFAAIDGTMVAATFEPPRAPVWRGGHDA